MIISTGFQDPDEFGSLELADGHAANLRAAGSESSQNVIQMQPVVSA